MTLVTERATTPNATYGDPANLRSITVSAATETGGAFNNLLYTQNPDGTRSTPLVDKGTWSGAPTSSVSFAADTDPGQNVNSQTHTRITKTETSARPGTATSPAGIANKTTRSVLIRDEFHRPQLTETHIYDGSSYILVDWTLYRYNPDRPDQLASVTYANGLTRTNTYDQLTELPVLTVDTAGMISSNTYDAGLRPLASTLLGNPASPFGPAQADLTSSVILDAAGNSLQTTTAGQSASGANLALVSSNAYNLAGLPVRATDPRGISTTIDYTSPLQTQVTAANSATLIATSYADGRRKRVHGTGTTEQHLQYGVNNDGSQWVKATFGAAGTTSPRWSKTTLDMLGRTIAVERPGPLGPETTTSTYEPGTGRLLRIDAPGRAPSLVLYDQLGRVTTAGLDTNGDNILTAASTDRLVETDTHFVLAPLDDTAAAGTANAELVWWSETATYIYPTANDPTRLLAARQRTLLSGSSCGCSQTRSETWDSHGNRTLTTVKYDPATQTKTTTVTTPNSTEPGVTVEVNGLLLQATDTAGITSKLRYDALRRPVATIDARTGQSTITYNPKGQVDATIDAAGFATTFTYERTVAPPVTGERLTITDPLTNTIHTAYDLQGRPTHKWGSGTYPLAHVYDEFGAMTELHTYRTANPALWSTPDWPAGPLPQADITTWHHNPATGLLDRKEYADGKGPTYTHTTAGRLATRTWARTDTNGNALVTTYTHDPATGELTGIDYSDAITPDVAHTYGRAGQRLTTTDGSGTTTNGYSSTLQLLTETFDRSAITGKPADVRTLHRDYETNQDTLPGRPAGIRLTGGDHDYHIDYGFDPVGRFKTLTTQHGEQPTTATYHYLTNSHLLERVHKGPSLVTRYEYEPNRDVKTAVVNGFGLNPVPANLISRYAYTYDAIRRRTSITTSGTAFGDHGYNLIGYNPRSEVTRTLKYLGLDHSDTNTPVTAENRAYHYDELGNRISATEGTDTTHYQSNELNQYTSISNQTATSAISNPTYDADGNTIDDARFIHAWNGQNRLISSTPISLTNGAKKVQSDYDATGRRWRKRVSTWSGTWSLSETRLFWYEGWNIIEETVQLATQTNTVHYDWGLDLSGTMQGAGGVGGLLREHTYDGSTVNTYHLTYDANGNVAQLIDTLGTLAASYECDAFGGGISVAGHSNNFRFSTKYLDKETVLLNYGYRYLDAKSGRWISRDPIQESGGIHLYAVSDNDLVNNVDALGLTIYIDGKDVYFVPEGRFGKNDLSKKIKIGVVDKKKIVFDPIYAEKFGISRVDKKAGDTYTGIPGGLFGTDDFADFEKGMKDRFSGGLWGLGLNCKQLQQMINGFEKSIEGLNEAILQKVDNMSDMHKVSGTVTVGSLGFIGGKYSGLPAPKWYKGAIKALESSDYFNRPSNTRHGTTLSLNGGGNFEFKYIRPEIERLKSAILELEKVKKWTKCP